MVDRLSRPRIRVRLTAWYAGSLLAVLLLSVAVLRLLLGRALEQQFLQSQRSTAQLATRFFRTEVAEYRTVEATLSHMARELVPGEHLLEFLRPDGVRYPESPIDAPSPMLTPPVRVLRLPLDPGLAPGWQVQVRTSAADLQALERRLNLGLVGAMIGVGLLALGVGWWIAGRTLRPVAQMAAAVSGVTAATSDRRLPIDNADDELGRLGTRFNALLDRLDGALAQQRRFLSDAAHELRTPIARMRSRVDVARLHAPSDETLQQLDRDLRRTGALVSELLELARFDSQAGGAVLAHGFLDDLVTDELRAWGAEAQRVGVALTLSAVDEAPACFDPVLVGRLVGVLVDNALRYTPQGGAVDVRVTAPGGCATLVVEDGGIGIAVDDRARVTERFYRGAAARAAQPEGSGLGLAIAADIVARHGATLLLEEGTDGRGTRATVRFPPFTAGSSSRPTLGDDDTLPDVPTFLPLAAS